MPPFHHSAPAAALLSLFKSCSNFYWWQEQIQPSLKLGLLELLILLVLLANTGAHYGFNADAGGNSVDDGGEGGDSGRHYFLPPPLSAGPGRSARHKDPASCMQTGGGFIGGFHHSAPAGPWSPLPRQPAGADWEQQASPPFGHKQINGKPALPMQGEDRGQAAEAQVQLLPDVWRGAGRSQVKGESCVGRRGSGACWACRVHIWACRSWLQAAAAGHWPLPAAAAGPARRTVGCQPTPS